MEEPGEGSNKWTPIRVDMLPARPQIVGQLHPGLMENWVTLKRLTQGCDTKRITAVKSLDLSTGTELESVAATMGRFLIEAFEEETKMAFEAARALEINRCAVLGVVEVGHITPAHTHLNGVIHWCGKGGSKLWSCRKQIKDGQGDDEVVILQEDGCVLWLPPGWSHEVRTLQGSMCNASGRELCMHWVTWCTPYEFFERTVLAFACNVIKESQQARLRPTMECLQRLHALVFEMEARKRARSFQGRHIRVGIKYQAVIPEYQGDGHEHESRHTSPR